MAEQASAVLAVATAKWGAARPPRGLEPCPEAPQASNNGAEGCGAPGAGLADLRAQLLQQQANLEANLAKLRQGDIKLGKFAPVVLPVLGSQQPAKQQEEQDRQPQKEQEQRQEASGSAPQPDSQSQDETKQLRLRSRSRDDAPLDRSVQRRRFEDRHSSEKRGVDDSPKGKQAASPARQQERETRGEAARGAGGGVGRDGGSRRPMRERHLSRSRSSLRQRRGSRLRRSGSRSRQDLHRRKAVDTPNGKDAAARQASPVRQRGRETRVDDRARGGPRGKELGSTSRVLTRERRRSRSLRAARGSRPRRSRSRSRPDARDKVRRRSRSLRGAARRRSRSRSVRSGKRRSPARRSRPRLRGLGGFSKEVPKDSNFSVEWKDDGGPIKPHEIRRHPDDKEYYSFEELKAKYGSEMSEEELEALWRQRMRPRWAINDEELLQGFGAKLAREQPAVKGGNTAGRRFFGRGGGKGRGGGGFRDSEVRLDPADSEFKTFEMVKKKYGKELKPEELDAYWRSMKPRDTMMAEKKGKGKGKATMEDIPAPDKLYGQKWEAPRSENKLRLVGELQPPGVNWRYVFKDESRRAFAAHLPSYLNQEECQKFFETIRDETTWRQPDGPTGPIPRKTAWMVKDGCKCTYRYGNIEVNPLPFPPWMIKLMEKIMPACGITLRQQWPDSCNVNLYEDGSMSVGWHSDDERVFQGKFRDIIIISLSLGVSRSFEVRLNWPEEGEKALHRLSLGNGDLMTMEGMFQKHMQHRVPKEGNVAGPRINLTWRWLVRHNTNCPQQRRRAGSGCLPPHLVQVKAAPISHTNKLVNVLPAQTSDNSKVEPALTPGMMQMPLNGAATGSCDSACAGAAAEGATQEASAGLAANKDEAAQPIPFPGGVNQVMTASVSKASQPMKPTRPGAPRQGARGGAIRPPRAGVPRAGGPRIGMPRQGAFFFGQRGGFRPRRGGGRGRGGGGRGSGGIPLEPGPVRSVWNPAMSKGSPEALNWMQHGATPKAQSQAKPMTWGL